MKNFSSNYTGETPQQPDPGDLLMSPALSYTLASLMIVTMIFTILGNALVITIIIRSPKIQNITSGFLLNLAIADMSTGIILLPFATSVQVVRTWIYTMEWCSAIGFFYMVVGIVSTWTLASLSMERFIAVNQPLKYHQLLNKSRAWVAVFANWALAIFMAVLPFMTGSGYVYLPNYGFCLPDFQTNGAASIVILTAGICLPFVLMCLAYVSIGRVACTQARRKVIECNEEHCAYVTPKNKDYRAAKILAGLAGVFAVCWLPFTFLCCWMTSATQKTAEEEARGEAAAVVHPLVTSVAFWFTLLSSAINPWLYSILNRAFRLATNQLLSQAASKLAAMRSHFRVGPMLAQSPQRGSSRGGGGASPASRGGGGGGTDGSTIEMSEREKRGSEESAGDKNSGTNNNDHSSGSNISINGSNSNSSGGSNSGTPTVNRNTMISSNASLMRRQSKERHSDTEKQQLEGGEQYITATNTMVEIGEKV